MIHSTRNLLAILVVSLFVAVISLPGITSAATAPKISTLTPVKRGMVAPVRIATDSSGNYYVTDPRSRGILKFNTYGRLVTTIPTAGIPLGVAVAANGNIIVTQGTYVSILDPNGVEVAKLGSGVGQFAKANGVTIDGNGYIYVTDGGLHVVQVFNSTGGSVTQFGGKGVATVNIPQNGKFNNPTAIVYEKAHNQIVVADTLNGRIQFFDATNYSFVKSIGVSGDGPLSFVSPEAIVFEYANATTLKRMYVVDTWKNALQVVDTEASTAGNFLSIIGCGTNSTFPYGMCGGVADGQLQLPSDAVLDAVNGRLLVVNGSGNIQVLGVDGGSSPFDNIPPVLTLNTVPSNTNQANMTISGTVEAGAALKVAVSTSAVAGPVNLVSTAWNTTVTGLNFGSNIITVTATDAAGNVATKTVNVIYSLSAPALTITTASNILTNTSSQTINGTVDAGATVTVTNTTTGASGAAVVTGTTWSYAATQLVEGANNLTVTATQPSSAAATATITVVRDTVQPVLTVSAIADGSYSSVMTQNIFGTVNDLHPGTVTVTVNGVPTTVTGSPFSVQANLQVGANTVKVEAVDLAGNAASSANIRTIYYDSTTPVVNITTPPSPADDSYVKTGTVGMSGTVTPAASTIAINGVSVAVDASGNWPAGGGTAPVTLASGLNTLEVVATSGAKSSHMKRSVMYDTSLPALAITSPAQDIATNQPNMNITGTVSDAGSAVTLAATVNGVAVSPAPVVSNGTFNFNATFGPVEQPYSVVVTATDAAGNPTTLPPRTITYDITPPALTLDPVSAGYPKSISGTVEKQASVSVVDGAASFPVTIVNGTTNATWSADLSVGNYNPSTIKITATDPATNPSVITGLIRTPITGDVYPVLGDGVVDINDARFALQCVVGLATPTAAQIQRGDIGPLLNGKANPNGKIDLVDAMLILRKALGDTVSW